MNSRLIFMIVLTIVSILVVIGVLIYVYSKPADKPTAPAASKPLAVSAMPPPKPALSGATTSPVIVPTITPPSTNDNVRILPIPDLSGGNTSPPAPPQEVLNPILLQVRVPGLQAPVPQPMPTAEDKTVVSSIGMTKPSVLYTPPPGLVDPPYIAPGPSLSCKTAASKYKTVPYKTWGTLPVDGQKWWISNACFEVGTDNDIERLAWAGYTP
jgi:hypothetical protein